MRDENFSKIKSLAKIIGGNIIIVEDEKPTMVIINIDNTPNLQKIKRCGNSNPHKAELPIEKINKEISIWKSKQEEKKLKQIESSLEIKTDFRGSTGNGVIVEKL